ncbi:Uncharacterised protein [Burkholderia pseudomallei]|nr:Uncharacterised protein [Burkholderia pseudomallei]VBR30110.1 Uncharacterised protein [Burkholderia pseudomallei]VBU33009.1 Uncharacterised protein [Burkholderia pseudomallei]VBU56017.1 Uncharacterised protein [Burkholderia pseudomallei]
MIDLRFTDRRCGNRTGDLGWLHVPVNRIRPIVRDFLQYPLVNKMLDQAESGKPRNVNAVTFRNCSGKFLRIK